VARRLVLVALAVAILLGATSALASSLSVTSARLTSFSGPTSVPTSTCSLGAEADSYVSNAVLQADTNFGTATELHVSAGLTDKRSFVRFELSCVPGTAEVKSATLRLVLATAPSSSRTYAAHRVSASWAEGSITWNNQPGIGVSSGTVATGTTNGVTLQWTVTSDVQAFVNGSATNNGWRIADSDESGVLSSQEGRFGSSEGTGSPELEVVFHP
jgi:hypothetical protein